MSATRVPRATTVTAACLALGAALLGPVLEPPAANAAPTPRIAFERWTTTGQLAKGSVKGVRISSGTLRFGHTTATKKWRGHTYRTAHWTSPWIAPGFGADEIIPSWSASTPGGSMVRIRVRGRTTGGARGSWDTVANWAARDKHVKRSSGGKQSDDYASVAADTVTLDGRHRYRSYQVRVVLMRRGAKVPSVRAVNAVASHGVHRSPSTSRTTMRKTVRLSVPRYSQMIHRGEYPQWDGGGRAWCSPTSTTMVLRSFGSGPTKNQYAWVNKRYPNRFVDHTARFVYDHGYHGAGNWAFNTAYAATFPRTDAFVTRLRDLRDAERFVKAGIPVVVSVAFGRGQLSGAPISSTNGHLMVIVGFTAAGRVVVNDPAASTNAGVRRQYARVQLERAWLRASGGTAYVIRPSGRSLPSRTAVARW